MQMNKFSLEHDYILRYSLTDEAELILPNQRIIVKKPLMFSTQLNVLVWNIFKQKRSNCIKLLEKYAQNTQLILLQEAQNTPKLINFITEHSKVADQVPAYSFNDIYAGVMTIADSTPIIASHFKEREPLIRIPKSALITEYLLANSVHTLLVANIHAVNFSFGVKVYQQQINDLITQIKHHQGPIILAGDFNSWSRQRLHLLYNLIRKIDLKPVNFSTDIRKTFMGKPLDFVFYRGMHVEHAEIVNTEASDHNPLLVNFRLDNANL